MASDKLIVLCTVKDFEEAREIARSLVKKKLAVCVNLIPKVNSIYRWKGKIEQQDEVLMLIKSTKPLFKTLTQWIKELHSYEVPEIVAIEPNRMSGDYEAWWTDQIVGPGEIED